MPSRFDVDFTISWKVNIDPYVDEVFHELKSAFLTTPRGEGFLDYPSFEAAYEALKKGTRDSETSPRGPVTRVVYARSRNVRRYPDDPWFYASRMGLRDERADWSRCRSRCRSNA